MARARTIKQGFFTNDDLGSLPQWVRILFAGLWCIADKKGRLLDRPKKIKTDVLPYDNVDVSRGLAMLADHHFITRYSVGGNRYIQVQNWSKHQSPHPREVESEIPEEPLPGNGSAVVEQLPSSGNAVVEQLPGNGRATARPGLPRARTGPYVNPSIPSVSSSSGPGPPGADESAVEKYWPKDGATT